MKLFGNRHKSKSRKQILLNGNLVTGYEEDLEKLMKNEGISYFKCSTCGNEIKWQQGLDIWCRCGKESFGPGIVFCG